jgi:hypothetical protein
LVAGRHCCVGLVELIPRQLKSRKGLQDADRFPALQPGRADVVVEPVADHHRLLRRAPRARKRKAENRGIRLLDTQLRY